MRKESWSGLVRVFGGEILQTPYWSPEVVAATPHEVRWVASTKTFGEPYGSQRGGVEMTLVGPPDASVELQTGQGSVMVPLGKLLIDVVDLPGSSPETGHLLLQPGTGGLTSLGRTEQRLTWVDEPGMSAYYYVRVIQVDGEMAWSSPVWVDSGQPDDA